MVAISRCTPVVQPYRSAQEEYGMFGHFRRYPWVLVYASPQQLIAELSERVIGPAAAKVRELRGAGRRPLPFP